MRLVRTAATVLALSWAGVVSAQTVAQPPPSTAPAAAPAPAAGPAGVPKAAPIAPPPARKTQPVRVVTKPVPYCWHAAGWNGPGWYRCGAAWSQGQGWGGGAGWNAWPVPVTNVAPPPRRRVVVVAPPPAPVIVEPPFSTVRDVGRFSPPAY